MKPTSLAAAPRGLVTAEVPEELARRLQALARTERASLFAVMFAGFAATLVRFGEPEDLAVLSALSGCDARTSERGGPLTSLVVLRLELGGDPTFRELAGHARQVVLDAIHQEAPTRRGPEDLAQVNPLPMLDLHFQAGQPGSQANAGGRAPEPVPGEGQAVAARLALDYEAAGSALALRLEYAPEHVRAGAARGFLDGYLRLLESAAGRPDDPISRLSMVGDAERRRLFAAWTGPERPYPHATIPAAVAAVAREHPDRVALEEGATVVTYRELERTSNRIAHRLRELGVGARDRVGFLMERSLMAPAVLLGIWKAGACWVPLDLDDPVAVIRATVDARRVVRVAVDHAGATLLGPDARAWAADTEWAELARGDDAAPQVGLTGDDPAYIAPTSGSSGRPKGSVNVHSALANFSYYIAGQLKPGFRILHKAKMIWDGSALELWAPLIAGGTVVLAAAGAHRDPRALAVQLVEDRIQGLECMPALLDALLTTGLLGNATALESVWCGGDVLGWPSIEEFRRQSRAVLHNDYGPSETCVIATGGVVPDGRPTKRPGIGEPLPNVHLYMLDRHGQPVPEGAPGELYIGGAGVGTGYDDDPEATRAVFLPDPFRPAATVYRTGDSARWTSDAGFEFLGRRDAQLKIRGVRIEPAEVEAVLTEHPAVLAAAVLSRPPGAPLTAWVEPRPGFVLDPHALTGWVRARLSAPKVPARIIPLAALPRLASGKIDRARLPDAPASAPASWRTPLEERLAALFAEVLRVERVGAGDDFFSLGGQSMEAALLGTRIHQELGLKLTLRDLFDHPDVPSLAGLLDRSSPAGERPAGTPREP